MNPAQRQIALRKMGLPSIPNDWDILTVGSIAQKKPNSIVGGPFGSDLVSTDYTPSGVPVIRGQNMGSTYVGGDFVFVSDEKAKSLNSNLATPGDVVFTQRGTLGQVSLVPERPFDRYLISQSQMKLAVDPKRFDVAFLCQYFGSVAGQQQILESAIQTGVPHTNLTILRGYFLPNPPLHEQQAIAAALSDADGVVAGLERVIAKKRLIKQGAMQDLLTARRRLPGFSGEWEVKRLGDLARFGKGKGLPKSDVLSAGPFACIHYGSLFRDQPTVISELQTFANGFNGSVLSDAGDVLMPTSDVTPSGLAVASCINKADVILGGDILIIKPDPAALNGHFLSSVIRNSKNQIMELVSGTTVFHIYAGDMARFTLNAPEVTEQQAIAAVLSDMDAEIQTLESRLTKAHAIKEGMMQNLLTGRVRLV
ncbi:MAG: restriction endonuclease subunit S [Roseovarius sp.]|jgi:type I restriction enzyme S subunit|nr:restriction endonuclease subunit S [Roseovarius sp.]